MLTGLKYKWYEKNGGLKECKKLVSCVKRPRHRQCTSDEKNEA